MKNAFLMSIALVVLAGCNTVQGVGTDLQLVGNGISHFAGEVNDEVFNRGNRQKITVYQPRNAEPAVPYVDHGTNSVGTQRSTLVFTPEGEANAVECDPFADELSGGVLPPC